MCDSAPATSSNNNINNNNNSINTKNNNIMEQLVFAKIRQTTATLSPPPGGGGGFSIGSNFFATSPSLMPFTFATNGTSGVSETLSPSSAATRNQQMKEKKKFNADVSDALVVEVLKRKELLIENNTSRDLTFSENKRNAWNDVRQLLMDRFPFFDLNVEAIKSHWRYRKRKVTDVYQDLKSSESECRIQSKVSAIDYSIFQMLKESNMLEKCGKRDASTASPSEGEEPLMESFSNFGRHSPPVSPSSAFTLGQQQPQQQQQQRNGQHHQHAKHQQPTTFFNNIINHNSNNNNGAAVQQQLYQYLMKTISSGNSGTVPSMATMPLANGTNSAMSSAVMERLAAIIWENKQKQQSSRHRVDDKSIIEQQRQQQQQQPQLPINGGSILKQQLLSSSSSSAALSVILNDQELKQLEASNNNNNNNGVIVVDNCNSGGGSGGGVVDATTIHHTANIENGAAAEMLNQKFNFAKLIVDMNNNASNVATPTSAFNGGGHLVGLSALLNGAPANGALLPSIPTTSASRCDAFANGGGNWSRTARKRRSGTDAGRESSGKRAAFDPLTFGDGVQKAVDAMQEEEEEKGEEEEEEEEEQEEEEMVEGEESRKAADDPLLEEYRRMAFVAQRDAFLELRSLVVDMKSVLLPQFLAFLHHFNTKFGDNRAEKADVSTHTDANNNNNDDSNNNNSELLNTSVTLKDTAADDQSDVDENELVIDAADADDDEKLRTLNRCYEDGKSCCDDNGGFPEADVVR